ncbi:hypothetical protein AAE478_007468 [Parahypoxylon ruwenzoriense]
MLLNSTMYAEAQRVSYSRNSIVIAQSLNGGNILAIPGMRLHALWSVKKKYRLSETRNPTAETMVESDGGAKACDDKPPFRPHLQSPKPPRNPRPMRAAGERVQMQGHRTSAD